MVITFLAASRPASIAFFIPPNTTRGAEATTSPLVMNVSFVRPIRSTSDNNWIAVKNIIIPLRFIPSIISVIFRMDSHANTINPIPEITAF